MIKSNLLDHWRRRVLISPQTSRLRKIHHCPTCQILMKHKKCNISTYSNSAPQNQLKDLPSNLKSFFKSVIGLACGKSSSFSKNISTSTLKPSRGGRNKKLIKNAMNSWSEILTPKASNSFPPAHSTWVTLTIWQTYLVLIRVLVPIFLVPIFLVILYNLVLFWWELLLIFLATLPYKTPPDRQLSYGTLVSDYIIPS